MSERTLHGFDDDTERLAHRILDYVIERVRMSPPPLDAPREPADLQHHNCIVYSRLSTGNRWIFESDAGPIAVDVKGSFRADNSEAVREGVVAGLGIAVIPAFAFTEEVGSGMVKVLLRKHEPKQLPMNAVYPSRRFVPLKVRAMIDYLSNEFALDPRLTAHAV